jgi:hypothetical protein
LFPLLCCFALRSIVGWGDASTGILDFPAAVQPGRIKSIAAGDNMALAINEFGFLVCWEKSSGYNCNLPQTLRDGVVIKATAAGGGYAQVEDGRWIPWHPYNDGEWAASGFADRKDIKDVTDARQYGILALLNNGETNGLCHEIRRLSVGKSCMVKFSLC